LGLPETKANYLAGKGRRMNSRSGISPVTSVLVIALTWGIPFLVHGAQDDDDLRTGPATITLPMIEEKKAASTEVEGKLRDDEISRLTDIVQNTPESPAKADLLFSLSEHYYEKSRALNYREMQDYDKVIQKWMEDRKKNTDLPEPAIDNRKSQAAMQQAMELWRMLKTNYKNYPRRDEVIATMGYNLYENGEKDEGLKMYRELLKEYPKSRFSPDALLAIGEHYFAKKDILNATKAYARALNYKDSKASTLALYKLAWCDYQLGNYTNAIEKFKKVVERTNKEEERPVEAAGSTIQLKRKTLRDVTLAYSKIGILDEAKDYFLEQLAEKGAFEYLRLLSLAYERQGTNELAIKSFRLLLNDYPTASDCPSFQHSIVQCFRKLNRRADVKRELNRLIEQYRPGSAWAEANKENITALQKAAALIEESSHARTPTSSGSGNLMEQPVSNKESNSADDALSYERIADFGSAATSYEKRFDQWVAHRSIAQDKKAQEALLKAASLRESMGYYPKAIHNYARYIKYFSNTGDASDQLYRLGLIYERLGKWRDADHIWEGYLHNYDGRSTSDRVLNVTFRHALALRHSGNQKESDNLFNKLLDACSKLSNVMRTPEIRHMISHARFLQREPEFNNFKTIKLLLPLNILKHNLFVKIDARNKLEKKYEEIVDVQDPDWSLAALVRIGQINQNLSQAMYEAPIPHDLTPHQQDSYVQELQKQALPFEEKAVGCYQKVIAIATAKGIYNEWMLLAQDLLHLYQPTIYPEPYKARLATTQRDALLDLGELSTKETNYITAIESYKNALRALPNDQRIMNNLIVCYRLNQQYQEAEAIGYQLLAHVPDSIEAYKNMALVYFDQGNYEMAELFTTHAQKQLQQKRQNDPSIPEDAGIYNNLGLVYLKSGRPRDALQQFSKALEIKPDHLDALLNTGALAHQYRDYARAQAAYEKVLELDPDNSMATRGLAYAVFGSGDPRRTIELMNRLITRDPEEIKAYYVLGVVYDTFLLDFVTAVAYYEQYLAKMGFALDSNDPVKARLAAAKAKLEKPAAATP
jgi:tetratricopeptide (TPR) repeat protein